MSNSHRATLALAVVELLLNPSRSDADCAQQHFAAALETALDGMRPTGAEHLGFREWASSLAALSAPTQQALAERFACHDETIGWALFHRIRHAIEDARTLDLAHALPDVMEIQIEYEGYSNDDGTFGNSLSGLTGVMRDGARIRIPRVTWDEDSGDSAWEEASDAARAGRPGAGAAIAPQDDPDDAQEAAAWLLHQLNARNDLSVDTLIGWIQSSDAGHNTTLDLDARRQRTATGADPNSIP